MKRITERNKIENMAQYPLTVKCRSCPKAGRGDIDICDDCLNAIYHRLADIEEILGDDYDLDRLRELVEADRAGRCIILPIVKVSEQASFAESLKDFFDEWMQAYDPSVGIFPMSEGENALAKAIMIGLESNHTKE